MTRALMNRLTDLRSGVLGVSCDVENLLADCELIFRSGAPAEPGVLADRADAALAAAKAVEADALALIAGEEVFGEDVQSVCAVLKVTSCLGRVANSVARLATRAEALAPQALSESGPHFAMVLRRVREVVHRAISAFRDFDDRSSLAFEEEIRAVDQIAVDVCRALLGEVGARALPVSSLSQYFFVLDDLDRIAGHAKSIIAALIPRTALPGHGVAPWPAVCQRV